MTLTSMFTASALGNDNAATYENYLRGVSPGMMLTSGDIPGREIYFGKVLAQLPTIGERQWNFRTNELLLYAAKNLHSELERLIAKYGKERIGIVLGASNTGIDEAENYVDKWLATGKLPVEFDFSMIELGLPSLYLKELLDVKGPAYTVSTACSSSTKALGAAKRLIENGICDAVITGGVDSRCRFAMNGFHALGALSAGHCRPLALDRDGINLGEGVALFTLESSGEGVKLLAVGESSDAYHITAPDPEGKGAEASMINALKSAKLRPSDIDYLNLHGTGTIANDAMELKAVARVFGSDFKAYESTKALTGHCLGAAGAIEAALCYLLIRAGKAKITLSNSFAFGGSNASVILSA